ncbi:MAG TPA: malto-oligosyltrehalose trehalohydrolase [Pseudolabrys sp.]|nr:malto-oligosyltrehalose trehalohydrolase [Pseudolabrys sp.]
MTRFGFGPWIDEHGAGFRLWAPAAESVRLLLEKPVPMTRRAEWFEAYVGKLSPGARYRFEIDGDLEIPDPASHFQPDDVAGPSELVDHRFRWQCDDWKGRPWEEVVFSEVHIGTFTREGTFAAAARKLDHFRETGITAIELMPLSEFPGRWNWGYDGVLPFAPDSSYGRPNDLKALIDAAHARGLMVFLDVVFNHFGPQGNYLGRIAPNFFSDAQTPWGGAIDYRVREVRQFAIQNAIHWLNHYRFDGLRLDAVHAIVTPGEPSILHELSAAVTAFASKVGRRIHLVLENDNNESSLLSRNDESHSGLYRAQWNDDYHHSWHVLLTGEESGYYRDYVDAPRHIVRTLAEGFAYQGEASPHRSGGSRGEPSQGLAPSAFVNFIQNHDQIGNRPKGERLSVLTQRPAFLAALSILLLQPSPPLLFMGDEWGAAEPFPFFCDFSGELADAVRNGRKEEFREAYAQYGAEIPDPLAAQTRESAILNWTAIDVPEHRALLDLVRGILNVRRHHIVPLLATMRRAENVSLDSGVLSAEWRSNGQSLLLLANLSAEPKIRPPQPQRLQAIWGGDPPARLPAWSVYAALTGP